MDPSSTRTGGSILGDKTRMTELSRDDNAYIRPCPSQGYLGGVTANAYEIIMLCEYAKYDIVVIETVGVGQSETQVVDLTDMVVLLVPPAGGDELQGIKRGIVEVADLIVINKADGSLLETAKSTQYDYSNALHFMKPSSPSWYPQVLLSSSVTKEPIKHVWNTMQQFEQVMTASGELQKKRAQQRKTWMWKQVSEELLNRLLHNDNNMQQILKIEDAVENSVISPRFAADQILNLYMDKKL